jgi:hypothetical protein
MRSRKIKVWMMVIILMVFCLGLPEAQATVVFDDGGIHTIDWAIYDEVEVRNSPLSQPTTVNLVTDGSIGRVLPPRPGWGDNLEAYQNSLINISGGEIGGYLWAWDNSQVNFSGGSIVLGSGALGNSQINISGGSIGYGLYGWGNSQINISGGSIGWDLLACDFSQVNISGGSIGEDLWAWHNSHVTMSGGTIGWPMLLIDNAELIIVGSDFAIDGSPVNFGKITSILGGYYDYEPYRRLTGTLANGDILNNQFKIGDYASITLVPEPATLFLLGFGAVMVRRRF